MLHLLIPVLLVQTVLASPALRAEEPGAPLVLSERLPAEPPSVMEALEAFQTEQKKAVLKEGAVPQEPKADCGCTEKAGVIQGVEALGLKPGETGSGPEVLVFISSSMNANDLQRLAEAAPQHKAVLVLRGLVENSFEKTVPFVQNLKGGVMLDPRLFEAFHVETVPTFIRLHEPLRLQGGAPTLVPPPHDRIAGNLTLEGALQAMKEGGQE